MLGVSARNKAVGVVPEQLLQQARFVASGCMAAASLQPEHEATWSLGAAGLKPRTNPTRAYELHLLDEDAVQLVWR